MYAQAEYNFARGYAAAMQGDIEKANKYLGELKTIRENNFRENYYKRINSLLVWELEIQVAIKIFQKDFPSAIKLAKQATLIEAKLPAPSGPPRILKPTYELLGEVYLKANKPVLAKEQFSISLRRHRNRLRSLIGAARSANLLGDKSTAKEIYEQLIDQLNDADQDFPDLVEAKEFLSSS
jgi:tetratricopeptide (TPR) repeat protein